MLHFKYTCKILDSAIDLHVTTHIEFIPIILHNYLLLSLCAGTQDIVLEKLTDSTIYSTELVTCIIVVYVTICHYSCTDSGSLFV